jgi:hypothetical protein
VEDGGAGPPLAWGVILAALLDAGENVASFVQLVEVPENPWPQIVWWCAVPKFLLAGAGILYALAGMALWLTTRER